MNVALRGAGSQVRRLAEVASPGSYLVASHLTGEHDLAGAASEQQTAESAGMRAQVRDSDEFARLAFAGLELVPPGVVLVSEWRSTDPPPRPAPAEVRGYGGVGRKR